MSRNVASNSSVLYLPLRFRPLPSTECFFLLRTGLMMSKNVPRNSSKTNHRINLLFQSILAHGDANVPNQWRIVLPRRKFVDR